MDRISVLPDELLLPILSLVSTKDAVATSVLSKRWKSLWKVLPKLDFDYMNHNTQPERFVESVYRSLLSHKAPVLESLRLKLDSSCTAVDIEIWVGFAIGLGLRELDIDVDHDERSIILPSSIYTCGTLEALKLQNSVFVVVPPHPCLPSLKTLHLILGDYRDDESIRRLLCSCPVLEDLVMEPNAFADLGTFTIAVPSLQRFSISDQLEGDGRRYLMNAPSLKYLSIVDRFHSHFSKVENMPELVEAKIDSISWRTEKLIRSLVSVERLSLCLCPSEAPYPTGNTFHRLAHLEICTCGREWWNLLMRMLEDSPKLRVLKLNNEHDVCFLGHWHRPISVPECVSVHLETLEWMCYEGKQVEKEVVRYILTNASRLKKASISAKSKNPKEKLGILRELASMPRRSPECQLVFH